LVVFPLEVLFDVRLELGLVGAAFDGTREPRFFATLVLQMALQVPLPLVDAAALAADKRGRKVRS
jgi:hypothetical protein